MKKILLALAVLVVLVIGAAIAIPFFIPLDTYKDKISAQVKAATGRDFAIRGKIAFSLFPRLAVEANDVSFGNAPGALTKDMATLKRLDVRLELIPLLSGRIAVDNFVLVEPVIDLEVDKQGKPNWQFAAAKPADKTAGDEAAKSSPSAGGGTKLGDINLGDIRLDNGHIRYANLATGDKYDVSAISMKLALPSLDQPMSSSGKATYNGKEIAFDLAVAKPRAATEGQPSPLKLKLGGDPVQVTFDGTVASGPPLKLSGTLDLSVPSVRGLASWAGKPLPASGGPLGPLAIAGKLGIDGARISFNDASLALDAIKGKGDFGFDGSGARPSITAKLALDKLDVNPYLPPEGGKAAPAAGDGKATPAPAAAPAGWSTEPFDVSPLGSVNADLGLTMNGLVFRKFEIGKSVIGVLLKDSKLAVDLKELALYGGSGVGHIGLNGTGVPALDTGFKLDKVQLQPLLVAASVGNWLSGTASTDFQITGTGKSQRDLVQTLAGKGALAVNSGSISGIDLGALLSDPVKAISENAVKNGKTDFASLTATYTIDKGIVKNSDLLMSSPVFQLSGSGTVPLPPRTVDYVIEPKLQAGRGGVGLAVPVKVTGTWESLHYQPDLSGALKDPGKALDALKNLKPGVGGTTGGTSNNPVGGALKGLFGK